MRRLQLSSLALLVVSEIAASVELAASLRGHQPAAHLDLVPVVTTTPRDRLSSTCREPKDPPRTADGEGPEEVFCCHTAEAKVAHLERRKKDCNDAVPCAASWKAILPAYLDYYNGRKDVLCKLRPTTTTTTTTTTVTTVSAQTEKDAEEDDDTDDDPKADEADDKEKKDKDGNEKDALAWCKDPCMKDTSTEEKCDKLCEQLNMVVADKMKAGGCASSSSSTSVTKVTKTTKVTNADGKTTVSKETKVTEGDAEAKDKAEEPTAEDAQTEEDAKDGKAEEGAKEEETPEEASKDEGDPKPSEDAAEEELSADEAPAEGE